MPTLQHMPAWTVNYDYTTAPAVLRSPERGGRRTQAKVSNKRIIIANAERVLLGLEMPYFEWFIRGILNDGALKFTDVYADHTGLNTGTVRILEGRYDVSTDKRSHIVTCQLEIFR